VNKKLKPKLEEGEELGVDWDRWAADRRPHRLKRKRDFDDVDPALIKLAAKNGSERLRKAVHTFPDPFFPEKFVWIQFADHKVVTGNPCRCGSRKLFRLHKNFARCGECGAQLLLKDEDDSQDVILLRQLKNACLERIETGHKRRDAYRGYAEKGDKLVLLFAEFRKDEEEELSPDNVYDRVERTSFIHFDRLEGFVDARPLLARDESTWDLVFTGPDAELETEEEIARETELEPASADLFD
jgi:hypothetical protein